ncbi:site-specific integrase [Henriciella barbarensis]|uniref:Site-specific integrase n=1 Tax=Henriciella barbarensis TaxID=86342 RepID=A0A399R6Z6_9PROT|nr:site-specific integrase [Henriciella barbarensis]RIJ26271.1 site-specific integrase [Henriciella barbarensis]
MPNAKHKVRLTKSYLENVRSAEHEFTIWDEAVDGLHVRIYPSQKKTFNVFYRSARRVSRRRAIGTFPSLTVEAARKKARTILYEASMGADPFADADVSRAIPKLSEWWEIFWSTHITAKKAKSTQRSDKAMWRKHLAPTFGRCFVDEIDTLLVQSWHAKLAHTPGAANRALSLLSTMMTAAMRAGYRATNPCTLVQKYPERRKQRLLSNDEFRRLFRELEFEAEQYDVGTATIIKLLALTGARRGEALNARWSEFDLNSDAPVWRVPTEHIKAGNRYGTEIERFLSVPVCQMLKDWKTIAPKGELVFPSPKDPKRTRYDLWVAWRRIRERANLPTLRLHDLRHNFATHALKQGFSLYDIGEALGHRSPMTTQRYATVLTEQKRKIMAQVGEHLSMNL